MSLKVFWIEEYETLGAKICKKIEGERGEVELKVFSDGERYTRLRTDVRGSDVVLIGGTISDRATMDLFDIASGLVSEGCKSLKILMPYFGYSTMERAVHPGEIVKAKTRARLFSAVPTAPFGNQVVMLDLHSEGIPFYFEGSVMAQHLYAKSLILEEAGRLGGENFILGAPDAGRAKWVQSLANDLGVSAGFVYKRRSDDGSIAVSGVNIPVSGTDVILYDDMIRSGGSILQAARAYKTAGAKRVMVIATHGLFTDGALENLKSSGLIESVSCTDSHPNAELLSDPFLHIISTDTLFAAFLKGASHAHH